MWFDVSAALQTLTAGEAPLAPVPFPPAKVAEVAEVAAPLAPKLDDEAAILWAIGAGRHRPGAIATATRLGVTRVYQLLDKMRDAGRVHVAPDGHISEGGVS
ncbi:MAG: hypothetical protein K9G71_12935 [Rhodobacteraceae bacterium]|nr:hypothetical protein [Paracoccaceae bacterium]MCF8515261.1 hypothetical protein [Paracoccaceae bacterium]MCF8519555.1 hypothetical protein [Paracoccaceae bacterium]